MCVQQQHIIVEHARPTLYPLYLHWWWWCIVVVVCVVAVVVVVVVHARRYGRQQCVCVCVRKRKEKEMAGTHCRENCCCVVWCVYVCMYVWVEESRENTLCSAATTTTTTTTLYYLLIIIISLTVLNVCPPGTATLVGDDDW